MDETFPPTASDAWDRSATSSKGAGPDRPDPIGFDADAGPGGGGLFEFRLAMVAGAGCPYENLLRSHSLRRMP